MAKQCYLTHSQLTTLESTGQTNGHKTYLPMHYGHQRILMMWGCAHDGFIATGANVWVEFRRVGKRLELRVDIFAPESRGDCWSRTDGHMVSRERIQLVERVAVRVADVQALRHK